MGNRTGKDWSDGPAFVLAAMSRPGLGSGGVVSYELVYWGERERRGDR